MRAVGKGGAEACPLCGSGARRRVAYREGPWRVRVCRRCGHGWTEPRPGPELLAAAYTDPAYHPDREMAAAVLPGQRARARALARAAGEGASVLEVGSGTGTLLAALREVGLRAVGLEPFAAVAAASERAHGVEVLVADIEDPGFSLERRFDAAVMIHVLEHLRDPVAALRRVRASLRPGGLLVLEVPNRRSVAAHVPGRRRAIFDLPLHLHHFTEKSLRRTLAEAGFVDGLVVPSIPRVLDRAAARLLGRGETAPAPPAAAGEAGGPAGASGGRGAEPATREAEPFVTSPSLAGRVLRFLPGYKLTATARAPGRP